MAKENEIWLFVEQNLKTSVPAYIKNILKVCGYDNGITIASIEEDDITYCEQEVRNGSVSKYYEGNKDMVVLDGSPKTAENFEFIRGHKRFLMKIRDFLRNHMEKNGPDSFVLNVQGKKPNKAPKRKTDEEKQCLPLDLPVLKRKCPLMDPIVESTIGKLAEETRAEPSEDMIKHRRVIFKKCIKSLANRTRDLFSPVKNTITSDFVRTGMKSQSDNESSSDTNEVNDHKLVARVLCPYCKKRITVFHKPTKKNVFLWNTSNYDRHLRDIHKSKNTLETKNQVSIKTTEKKKNELPDLTKNEENSFTTSSTLTSEPKSDELTIKKLQDKTIKGGDNSIASPRKNSESSTYDPVMKDHLKCNSRVNDVIESCSITSKPNTCIEKSKLVSYSDTSEDSEDEEHSHNDNDNGSTSESTTSNIQSPIDEIVDNQFKNEIVNISVLRNGYTSVDTSKSSRRTIVTYNTCAFDSLFSIYTSFYFDQPYFREQFLGHSKFAVLVKAYFDAFNSKSDLNSLEVNKIYNDRNIILEEILSYNYYKNSKLIKKNGEMTYINCNTGIGGFFGQLCLQMCQHIGSAIEEKTCGKCKKTTGKILPFVSIAPRDVDLSDIQKSIRLNDSQNRLCNFCKGKCIDTLHSFFHDNRLTQPLVKQMTMNEQYGLNVLSGIAGAVPNLTSYPAAYPAAYPYPEVNRKVDRNISAPEKLPENASMTWKKERENGWKY